MDTLTPISMPTPAPVPAPVAIIRSIRAADSTSVALLAIAQREGEDAHLTGMTRSLHRRLLGLNLEGSRKPIAPSHNYISTFSIQRIA